MRVVVVEVAPVVGALPIARVAILALGLAVSSGDVHGWARGEDHRRSGTALATRALRALRCESEVGEFTQSAPMGLCYLKPVASYRIVGVREIQYLNSLNSLNNR